MPACDFLEDFFDEPPASFLKPHLTLVAEGFTSPLTVTDNVGPQGNTGKVWKITNGYQPEDLVDNF